MGWSIVQSGFNSAYGFTYGSNVTSGHLLVCFTYGYNSGQTATVTSNRTTGNWTQVKAFKPRGGDTYGVSMFWAVATSSGACTISISGLSSAFPTTLGIEVSGNAASPFDSGASASGVNNGTVQNATLALTPSAVAELVIGSAICLASGSGTVTGAGSGNIVIGSVGNPLTVYETPATASQVTLEAIQSSANGWAFVGASFTSPVDISSLSISPNDVVYPATGTATVTLNQPAPSGGTVVTLSSNNTAVATVPASVTVTQGNTTAQFTVTSQTTNGVATISATVISTATAQFTVQPDISALSLSPTSVTYPTTSTGTVTLTSAAPSGGTVVTLSSSNTSVATVPASVTVAQGNTTANFTVTSLNQTGNSTISGTVVATKTAILSVASSPDVSSVSASPSTIPYPQISVGTITLTQAAGSGGAVVSLSSSNTGVATVPATMTVPMGATTATFTIRSVGVGTSTIGATLLTEQTTSVTVESDVQSVSISPAGVVYPNTATGTVNLTIGAQSGGATVTLSSSDPTVATVPASINIAQGLTSGTFTVTPQNKAGNITISATIVSSPSAPFSVVLETILSVVVNPSTVEFPTSPLCTVTVSSPAPASGFTINLSSSDTTIATVPATVVIQQGNIRAQFVATSQSKTGQTTITASATDAGSAAGTVNVIQAATSIAPPPKLPFSKRTTAAVALFSCIFIASMQGAQAIATVPAQIGNLALYYGQMTNLYPTLIHQDTANNDSDLDAAINSAVTIVGNLNTTMQGLTVAAPNQITLAQMQVTVYNALVALQNAEANEVLPDPD